MISLNSAIKFHGHLGPWLVIGLFMGDYGLRKIKAKRYFGAQIAVSIPNKKPFSCLIDGLQLSSGCTLGKGNIRVISAKQVKLRFTNKRTKKKIVLGIKNNILNKLLKLKTHNDSVKFAKQIYKMKPNSVVKILEGEN
ncbi:MAG: hypothetical protein FJZ11_00680 [Candidatus Omnitrophica bacterium]|nr:hypothetical protein [Candidatus Omnitrophota bacterium]